MKVQPDNEQFFSYLGRSRQNSNRRCWIVRIEALEDYCGIEEDMGQMSTDVEIVLQLSHNTLTIVEEYEQ